MSSIGEEIPKQQARARELIRQYNSIGPVGSFGVMTIEAALQRSDRALASGDILAILKSYQELKGLK